MGRPTKADLATKAEPVPAASHKSKGVKKEAKEICKKEIKTNIPKLTEDGKTTPVRYKGATIYGGGNVRSWRILLWCTI